MSAEWSTLGEILAEPRERRERFESRVAQTPAESAGVRDFSRQLSVARRAQPKL
jgi:hypothetical protein